QAARTLRVARELRHLALPHRRQLFGGSDARQAIAARHDATREPRRSDRAAVAGRARARASGTKRGDPAARARRARRPEPARARGLHPAAPRRAIDRRDQQDARPGHERCEAQRVSRREETARGAGATEESGIVSTHYSDDELTLYYYGE